MRFWFSSIALYFSLAANAQQFVQFAPDFLEMDSLVSKHTVWVDFDNDADLDLFSTNIYNENNKLYLNNRTGFRPADSMVLISEGGNSYGSAWADIDHDRDLDAFVYNIFGQKNYYYKNNQGIFQKIYASPVNSNDNNVFSASFCDYDNDGDPDLFITDTELWSLKGSRKKNTLYINDGQGNFTPDKLNDFSSPRIDSRGCAWGDYNNDGWQDLFIANFGSRNMLFKNNADGTFSRVTNTLLTYEEGDSNAADWGDFDNDGTLDLFLVNVNAPNVLYINNGDGTFIHLKRFPFIQDKNISGSVIWGDHDNDGYLDLYGTPVDKGVNTFYANAGNTYNWIRFKLRGYESNFYGIGAKIKVKAKIDGKNTWQIRELRTKPGQPQVNSMDLHFGIKTAEKIDSVIIYWPSGKVQTLTNVQPKQVLVVEEDGNAYKLPSQELQLSKESIIKDISLRMASDSIKTGEVYTVTLFYENKGIMPTDITVRLEVDKNLEYLNGFPVFNKREKGSYEWNFRDLKPGAAGNITVNFKVPADAELTGRELITKAIAMPLYFDEQRGDNTVIKIQEVPSAHSY